MEEPSGTRRKELRGSDGTLTARETSLTAKRNFPSGRKANLPRGGKGGGAVDRLRREVRVRGSASPRQAGWFRGGARRGVPAGFVRGSEAAGLGLRVCASARLRERAGHGARARERAHAPKKPHEYSSVHKW